MYSQQYIITTLIKHQRAIDYLLSQGGGGGSVSTVFGRSGNVVAANGDYTFSQITSTPTTLAGYGITDGAPVEGSIDITTVGAITTGTWNADTITVPQGGTGQTSFTSGRILYGNGTSSIATSTNLFWDVTNSRLGVGTITPGFPLEVVGTAKIGGLTVTGAAAMMLANSAGTFSVSGTVLSLGSATTTQTNLFGNVGIGTTPTHPLTLGLTQMVTNGGIALYSTADQTTNYQRLRINLSSVNVANYNLERGGTGVTGFHSFNIGGTAVLQVDSAQAILGGNLLFGTDGAYTIGRNHASPFRPRDVFISNTLQVGLAANTASTARLDLVGSTTAVASLRLRDGVTPTTPNEGEIWKVTDKFFGTISTGIVAKEFTLNDAALTSGRIPFVTTNGRLTDSTSLAWNSGSSVFSTVNGTFTGNIVVSGYVRAGGSSYQSAHLIAGPSVVGRASLNIQQGVAPTSPSNGDVWQDGTNICIQIGGVTKIFTLV